MKLIEKLTQLKDDGWLISSKHPTYDLYIWNYSQSTQYESYWNEFTLMCRGLVTDGDGNIISRGFDKFFNWEENKLDLTKLNPKSVRLFEKVDGSYIGAFWYDNQWITNSRGSFTTEQAIKAKEHLDKLKLVDTFLSKYLTHNFEIIYSDNRIVVDYGNRDELVYLASTNKHGDKFYLTHLPYGLKRARTFSITFDYKTIKELNIDNEEGMVGVFPTGEMFKIKYDNYVKLHGILTNTSSYTIWELLRDGKDLNKLIDSIPDEFFDFVKSTKASICADYDLLLATVTSEYNDISDKENMTDKEFAEYVFAHCKYPSQMFSLRNNRKLNDWLWKSVKPEYKLPFKNEH